ncbi:MAG TPA: HD domain-containing protein [Thermoleophilaceae bacterium]
MAQLARTSFRERIERLEESLSPLATRSYPADREEPEPDSDHRTPFQRDRDRIVHSKAFRRLKHKTQVFIAPEGDHYRTRLTHTLEASGIARGVARALGLNEDLTEAIGLGHDLGHPPFGHTGEAVLDACLRERWGVASATTSIHFVWWRRSRGSISRHRCVTGSSATRGRSRRRRLRAGSSG